MQEGVLERVVVVVLLSYHLHDLCAVAEDQHFRLARSLLCHEGELPRMQ
jgi:hypothetical protein